ncbi:SusC/RagA family TonB-linked outer membrane protein [Saccharicrinis aurantiacus]|uniref:SusC/RagA family TonB-linked outer membrane protein n=1 Tax=Saccharicrinis aurantiacus TaxID=1849719 RepID=UPI00248FE101|nr:TonB-dependent receptor [Saccharicrinis aurantiacus]
MKKSNSTTISSLLTKRKEVTISSKLLKSAMFLLLMCLNFSLVMAQTQSVSGTITDASGEALPGVNVVIKGTTVGTVTNIDGKYSIQAMSSDVLVFSFIGFNEQEVPVGDQTTISPTLTADTQDVDEVVVVGYGVQKKSLVTGAIAGIESKDLENNSWTNAESAMQGRTPGVVIVPQSGSPGAGMNIKIRGAGTNGDSNPLYIVDGIRMRDITSISPSDIMSIEVLKDGASSAIYGAEGGNGVVMVTTKKGKAGEGKVTYDFSYGIQSAGKLPDLLNASEYYQYQSERIDGEGNSLAPTTSDYDTDWLGEIFSTAPIQSHNVSFSGGTEKSKYFTSIGYVNQEGIIGDDKSGFERFTARLNADQQVKSWLKVGANVTYARSKRKVLNEDDEFGGLISSALLLDPYTPVTLAPDQVNSFMAEKLGEGQPLRQDANGNYYAISENVRGEMINPFLQMDIATEELVTDRFFGAVTMEVDLTKDLKFTSRPGLDLKIANTTSWTPQYYYSNERNNTTLATNDNYDMFYQWQWENFFNYDKSFGDHSISAVLGMSAQMSVDKFVTTNSSNMPREGQQYAQHAYTSNNNGLVDGNRYENKLVSYFGRLGYSYKGKYMLQATLRNDITSTTNVPEDGIGGIFPSVSAGWTFTEEDFFSSDFFDSGKLRASWGQNGSINSIQSIARSQGQFLYSSSITTSKLRYPTSYGFVTAAEPGRTANPDLTWETSEQTNIGIDLRMIDSKLSFSMDYFSKETKDLLMFGQPPAISGTYASMINAGDVKNSGFEFSAGWKDYSKAVKYGINANFATLKNEVTRLNVVAPRLNGTDIGTGSWVGATAFEVGEPIWYYRGYKTNGINSETGQPIYVDKDGNDTDSPEDDDRTNIGSPHPTYSYGLSAFVEYKGFDFNVLGQGQGGNQVVYGWIRTDRLTSNMPKRFYDDRWTPDNKDASMPSANPGGQMYASDIMVQDADFFRIKQIQLGYSLPKSVLETIKLSSVRVYVSLDDYFTFTKYEGMDPEAGSDQFDRQGIDRGVYPTPRKVMFGLNVSF